MAKRDKLAYGIRLQKTDRHIQLLFKAGEGFRVCYEVDNEPKEKQGYNFGIQHS